MSFFSSVSSRAQERPVPQQVPARDLPLVKARQPDSNDIEKFYQEIIDRRPALLDEKLKIHAQIIDEFNLSLLERLPHEELVKQVRAYVANYIRVEKISLNQRELEVFSDEIIN